MNLLKSVSKGIEKAVEIEKLDLIVERRVKQYEKEVQQVIDTPGLYLNDEQVVAREEEIINLCLEKYDGEACPYMKKQCEPTWRDGGGNNLEVRKRMLLRELNSRRGKLATGLAQRKIDIDNKIAIVDSYFSRFETNTMMKLPLRPSDLKIDLDTFLPDVNVLLAPYDFAGLNTIVQGRFLTQQQELMTKIQNRNQELIQTEVNRLRLETINKTAITLNLVIRTAVEDSLNELKANLPPYLSVEDVSSFDAELFFKADKATKAYISADYQLRN